MGAELGDVRRGCERGNFRGRFGAKIRVKIGGFKKSGFLSCAKMHGCEFCLSHRETGNFKQKDTKKGKIYFPVSSLVSLD